MKRAALMTIVVAMIGTAQPAQAVDKPELLGGSNPTPRTTSILHPVQPSQNFLSEEAHQLAVSMGVMPQIARAQQLRGTVSTEYVALKQDVLESIVIAGYEVDTVTARIDRELANASEILAYLAERRDRAVRLNTYADFISGGITGIISGGLKLAEVPGITSDLLDTIEGGLQTSLATWAFQQQHGEARHERGTPSILAHLFGTKSEAATDYPPAVWAFLSTPLPAAKNGECRLDLLVARWKQLGHCFTHKGHRRKDERLAHVAGQAQARERQTIDILEDRVAMLNDLRATVVQMDSDLLEMTQTLHGQRTIQLAQQQNGEIQ